jgi:SAM-dependent methyltransferase
MRSERGVAWRWLAKVAVQSVLSRLPAPERTNYWMQRHVSRRLPRPPADFDWHVVATAPHVDAWERHVGAPLADATVFEFGAGYDLIGPASMWAFGANSQTLLDVRPNLRPELVRHTLTELRLRRQLLERSLGRSMREAPPVPGSWTLQRALADLGMRYLAPADARCTGFADGSIDMVVSTFTLEHIPRSDLVAILRECARILKPHGIFSAQIDLKDHFSYIDPAVESFRFLRYSERRWRFLNPPLHYQSRLRWPEYRDAFETAGLHIVDVTLRRSDEAEIERIAEHGVAERFRRFSLDELAVREAHVVLAPARG